jgi:hypothetical protein
MGKYINDINGIKLGSTFDSKCKELVENGAVQVNDSKFVNDMICVVDNSFFAAAAYAYSESEYKQFKQHDGRTKAWFTLNNVSEYAQ